LMQLTNLQNQQKYLCFGQVINFNDSFAIHTVECVGLYKIRLASRRC
jgi:hypothetical protein